MARHIFLLNERHLGLQLCSSAIRIDHRGESEGLTDLRNSFFQLEEDNARK